MIFQTLSHTPRPAPESKLGAAQAVWPPLKINLGAAQAGRRDSGPVVNSASGVGRGSNRASGAGKVLLKDPGVLLKA